MKLLTDQEIARRLREAFGRYPVTDVSVEALCHNLQNPFEGYIIVDEQDRILFLSDANEKFFAVPGSGAFLKPNKDFNPTSHLTRVMRTGKAEVGEIAEFQGGQIRIVARFPIGRDGKVIGAYGKVVFANVDKLNLLTREIDELRSRLKVAEEELSSFKSARYSFDNIIGKSPGMRAALDLAQRVCRSDASVLLVGETGTGKEMFAHAVHFNSLRRAGPFVRVNCAAIPDDLAEAEFFGYKRGAFTGAHPKGKSGLFRQAHGGSVFLDEVHELSPRIQSKLLRVLQEREFTPVGAVEPEEANFRLIAATSRDLSALVRDGKFRGDLYFRINRVPIQIPPLRDRGEDILHFVRHFSRMVAAQNGCPEKEVAPQALQFLLAYRWPGNVRELANVLEQAFWKSRSGRIEREDLPPPLDPERAAGAALAPDRGESLSSFLTRMEKEAIHASLAGEGGNRTRAARRLGIHRTHLHKKMKKLGIEEEVDPGS